MTVNVAGSGSGIALGASLPTGNPNYHGLQPVGGHIGLNEVSTLSDAALSGTYLIQHYLSAAPRTIAFVYSNTDNTETPGANAITIKCSARMSDTSIMPMTFKGQPSITLQPGCDAMTDPISVPADAGDFIQSLTYVSVSSGTWPGTVYIPRRFTKEGYASGVDMTANFVAGDFDFSTTQAAFGPVLVLGATELRRPIIGVLGDSIAGGTGDPTLFGMYERALTSAVTDSQGSGIGSFSYVNLSQGGEGANLTFPGAFPHRLTWLGGCTDVICALGENSLGNTPTQIATALLGQWKATAGLGSRVYQSTITPQTTSTDGWATSGNQTTAHNATRVQVNNWLRAGAKVDGGGAPLFDGTGTPSPYLTGILEIAYLFETAHDSGIWISPGYTADGVHPTTAGHELAAPTIKAWADTLTV